MLVLSILDTDMALKAGAVSCSTPIVASRGAPERW